MKSSPLHSLGVSLLAGLLIFGVGCTTTQSVKSTSERPMMAPMSGGEITAKTETTDPDRIYTVGGLPKSTQHLTVLRNIGYAVGYSEELLDPLWAAYYCGPKAEFPFNVKRPPFSPDERLPEESRVTEDDYDRPKDANRELIKPLYDRGHMAPNYAICTRYGNQAQAETFLTTNIVPQRSTLNSQTWKALEAEIARTFSPAKGGLWVIVGPIFKGPHVRFNGKAVIPTSIYCILLEKRSDGSLRAVGIIMDQTVSGTRKIGEFFHTVDEIEQLTGLDFFSGLPDSIENALESAKPDSSWDPTWILNPGKRYPEGNN